MRQWIAGLMVLMFCSSAMGEHAPEYSGMDDDHHEARAYDVNADGGRYIHTRRDCPSVAAGYQDGMTVLTAEEAAALGDAYQLCAVCGDGESPDAREAQPAAVPEGMAYVVGMDLQEGLYSFFSSDDTPGVMTIANWDGSIAYQQEVYSGWYETMRVYNEQTVYLPENCQGEFHQSFASSAYDTGSRGLYLREPGTYCAGKDMLPGLYIVQNDGEEPADVAVSGSDGDLLDAWRLQPGTQYTILLDSGHAVTMGEGCLLRSMTTELLLQEGAAAYVAQGRYIMGMQLPERTYTFTGREGESLVQVTLLANGAELERILSPGETMTLDADVYDPRELLVEMVNVDVSWEPGEG
ncbi:MAG: hypothetical protein ACI4O7_06220 [Aristaeellaceae bacterium]